MALPSAFIPAPAPHPVQIPHPVIIPGHGNHGDVDISWPWISAYIAVGIIMWIVAAIILTRRAKAEAKRDRFSPFDRDDAVMAVVEGFLAGLLWPLAIVGYGVWRIVQHFTQDRVDLGKEQR